MNFLDPDSVIMRSLLERNESEAPDEAFVFFEDGTSWTRREAVHHAYAAANELRSAGVEQGDAVAVVQPNGAGYLRAWWGVSMLGAAMVPVNPAYRGVLIAQMLKLANPKVIICDAAFRERLAEVDLTRSTTAMDPTELLGPNITPPELQRPIQPWDAASFAMTSGTTGPSKLVRVAHAHAASAAWASAGRWGLTSADTYLCDVPLVHVGGLYFIQAAIAGRASIAVRTRPDLAAYWEVARDSGATVGQLYGTMVSYVDAQPNRGAESQHRLRLLVTLPLPPDPEAFREKFHVRQLTLGYGSTEIGSIIGIDPGQDLAARTSGRLFPGWHVRLVDENDIEVPVNTPGEAIVRADTPWLISTEYVNDPASTATAWRNGWFHTGDLLRVDEDGNYYFVDRAKDSLRRRGQNISSVEVEMVVQSFPGILEVAVVPDRSNVEVEDEVKVWIVLTDPAGGIDLEALLRHCADLLPHYMVPRYFQIAEELPKTPSGKVQKHRLRERGNDENTWDRQAQNLDVTRRGVEVLECSGAD